MKKFYFNQKSLVKNLVLLCIFTVHYSTRTPLYILYCLSVCFVIVGPSSIFTTLAYLWAFAVLLMSFFLVLLFNLKFCKSWAIDLVGVKYFTNYVSHSYAGLKSFAAVLATFLGFPSLGNGSAKTYAEIHFQCTGRLENQIKDLRSEGRHEKADEIQDTINKMNENFVPGGILSRGFASGGINIGTKPRLNPICSSDDTKNVLFKDDI